MQKSFGSNLARPASRNKKVSSSKFRDLAKLFVIAIIFFAFGYNAKTLSLPTWLRGGGSSVRISASGSVDVEEIYSKLRERFDGELSDEQVEEGIKRGLVSSTGDPYTTFFTKAEYERFNSTLNGQFSGIGAELGKKGDQIVVIAPVDGAPAAEAGIKAGDAILAVDGESTEGKSVDEVVGKIRGEAGTKVKLTLISNGERKDLEITRSDIKIDSVKYEKLNDSTGYIKISQFGLDTASLTTKAVEELKSQGVNRIVLDLRNNGGGYVDQAVRIAGIWLDSKVVLSERFRGQETSVQRTSVGAIAPLDKNELIVLVNEGSASASEILAASLRDEGGVKLVGQKTFGKGSVQDLIKLSDESRLKITIAHWFTPRGKSIDKEGIEPDYKVDSSLEGGC